MLEPEHGVCEQHSGQAENDEGQRIAPPILLRLRVDAEDPIDEALDGFDRPVQPGLAFGLEDPDEVETQRLRDREQEADEEGQLKPAERSIAITSSELFGPQDAPQKIAEEQEPDDESQDVGHR